MTKRVVKFPRKEDENTGSLYIDKSIGDGLYLNGKEKKKKK